MNDALNELHDTRVRLNALNSRERSRRISERHDKSFALACDKYPELRMRHAYRGVDNPWGDLVSELR